MSTLSVSPSPMSMTPPASAGERPASHRVTRDGERVTVHGLECFVGFDADIDSPDNKRITKYDEQCVRDVVERTQKYMARGQNPKLIVGHNRRDASSDAHARPAVGDITNVRFASIGGAPGIVGDVEMSAADFDEYLKSNRFPRRSAEIWKEGYMSDVALLGSEAPARPLPDTKFSRSLDDVVECELFSRTFPAMHFAEPVATPTAPGPGNSHIPTDKKKGRKMTREEILASIAELNSKLAEMDAAKDDHARSDADRDDFARKLEEANDRAEQFKRQRDELVAKQEAERESFMRERYTAKLEQAQAEGYAIGDTENFSAVLDRIVNAAEPAEEFNFLRSQWRRDPIGVNAHETLQFARVPGEGASTEREEFAAKAAMDRCTREGNREMYDMYYAEALAG